MKPDFNRLVNTWERAYIQLNYKAGHAQRRLSELLTWDKPGPGRETEHAAKVQACKNIIENKNKK